MDEVDGADGADGVLCRLRLGPEGVRSGPEVDFRVGPQRYFRVHCRRYRGVLQLHVKSFYPRSKKARFHVFINSTTASINHHSTMPRTLLEPISSNYCRRLKLILYKRGIITRAHKHSYILKYIAKAKNTSLNTIKKTILHAT